ncbi:sugar-binding protein [Limnochorda pilosa]|uniref:sugar-binding protein n=1 Tax=Limnochorda pilosa TaxID=1555112 RepID=UPI001DADF0D8|nr:sugar-binding protein [Limnochorda pilosa]MBO2486189.1 sugar ABC transporter substrate-binding protein [Bacillota bacterium]
MFRSARNGMVLAGLLALLVVAAPVALAQTYAVVPKSVDNPFFIDVEEGAKAAAAELGVRMQFVGPQTHDIAQQIAILEDLILRGVDGIALSPVDAQSVIPVVERARAAGIPVVTFDSDTAGGAARIAFIGTDNFAAGVSAGEAFIRALPEGTYAIITGGLGAQNLNDRIDGFRSVLAKFGDAYREIPGSPFPTEDDVQRGIQVIEDLRTAHPDLDGIFMSGGWPQFAPQAYVEALGPWADRVREGTFVVVSFDLLEQQVELLRQGYSTAQVSQRPYAMGYQAIYALHRLHQGEELDFTVLDTGSDIVTPANVDQFAGK